MLLEEEVTIILPAPPQANHSRPLIGRAPKPLRQSASQTTPNLPRSSAPQSPWPPNDEPPRTSAPTTNLLSVPHHNMAVQPPGENVNQT